MYYGCIIKEYSEYLYVQVQHTECYEIKGVFLTIFFALDAYKARSTLKERRQLNKNPVGTWILCKYLFINDFSHGLKRYVVGGPQHSLRLHGT